MKKVLRYIGKGYLLGVPARDLDEEDILELETKGWSPEELIQTGLYAPMESSEKKIINPQETKKYGGA